MSWIDWLADQAGTFRAAARCAWYMVALAGAVLCLPAVLVLVVVAAVVAL